MPRDLSSYSKIIGNVENDVLNAVLGKNHSIEKIKAEIEKCDLLCISCHHKHHGIENAAS